MASMVHNSVPFIFGIINVANFTPLFVIKFPKVEKTKIFVDDTRRFSGRTLTHEPKTCLVFCIYLENGKRYSVDTDIIVCTMSIPISLSG